MPTLDSFDLYGKKFNFSYDLLYPIGVTYTQYPGMKSPMELWGDISKWEVVNYHGNFFRAEGGLALPYTKVKVETTNGLVFKAVDGDGIDAISVNSTVGIVGSNETRTVTVTGTTPMVKNQTFTVNQAFTAGADGYKKMTDVFVLQKSQLPNVRGAIDRVGGCSGMFRDIGAGEKQHTGSQSIRYRTIEASLSYYDGTYVDGGEARPDNISVRIWVRTE